jgi:hypothetical protein
MSLADICRHSGVSKTQVQRQIRDGRLRVIRVGEPGSTNARIKARVSDYEAWLDSMYSEPKDPMPEAEVAPLRAPRRRTKKAAKSAKGQE